MRAYALEPNDPVNILSLAITLFMRAMNRRTTNRHFQIMQVRKKAEKKSISNTNNYQ